MSKQMYNRMARDPLLTRNEAAHECRVTPEYFIALAIDQEIKPAILAGKEMWWKSEISQLDAWLNGKFQD